jgi:small subunit ribosomal protein S5
VVKGGRRLRFRLTVVIGDKKGRVGFGIGKSAEVMTAIQKAVVQAKRNLITVPMNEGTLPHEANAIFKSSRVLLFPAPEGKGVIAGGAVRKILELAGVRDVLSKSHGSRNKLNVAVATFNALQSLEAGKNPGKKITKEDVAIEKEEKTEETKEKPSTATKATGDKKASPAKKAPAKKPAAKKSDTDKK